MGEPFLFISFKLCLILTRWRGLVLLFNQFNFLSRKSFDMLSAAFSSCGWTTDANSQHVSKHTSLDLFVFSFSNCSASGDITRGHLSEMVQRRSLWNWWIFPVEIKPIVVSLFPYLCWNTSWGTSVSLTPSVSRCTRSDLSRNPFLLTLCWPSNNIQLACPCHLFAQVKQEICILLNTKDFKWDVKWSIKQTSRRLIRPCIAADWSIKTWNSILGGVTLSLRLSGNRNLSDHSCAQVLKDNQRSWLRPGAHRAPRSRLNVPSFTYRQHIQAFLHGLGLDQWVSVSFEPGSAERDHTADIPVPKETRAASVLMNWPDNNI